jgi:MscS family membrane protein|tara:strand:+ start:6429 stop:7529 length:1101 start_codon:yes stop_codon:yes gene_type:complete
MKEQILQSIFFGNTLEDYIFFFCTVIVGLLFKKLLSKYLSHMLYKVIGKRGSKVGVDKFDQLLTKPIGLFIMLSIIFIGSTHLQLPSFLDMGSDKDLSVQNIISKCFSLVYIYAMFNILLKVVDYVGLILKQKAELTENKMDDQLIPFATELGKIIIVIFAVFIILGNVFGINITALATGLGIGGLAIAMASKESLENLLGSFTIFFDRPFTVGDIVQVGTVTGKVEKVGFRSTRIITFDRSIVTVPNKKMVDAELDNLGLRPVRRVKFHIGLTYSTSPEQIKNIVEDLQEMVNIHPKTNADGRVRFQEFGASSLDVLVIYYVDSPKWEDLINAKQDINFKIMDIVKKHNSDFAFPSTSVYLQQNN